MPHHAPVPRDGLIDVRRAGAHSPSRHQTSGDRTTRSRSATRTAARRAVTGVVAGLAIAGAAVGAAIPAAAEALRSSGDDRYETAAALSNDVFDADDVDTAYLATGADFADALTAGGPAARDGSPVLLTRQGGIPEATADELDRLDLEEIIVVGGTAVIDPAVEDEAADLADSARRIAGDNRFETADDLAAEFFDAEDTDVVFMAFALDFPDALPAVTAAARFDAPLLLTGETAVPDSTMDTLRDLDPSRVVIAGGPAVIDSAVDQQIGAEVDQVDRQFGANRYETAARLALDQFTGAREILLANGTDFPDAIPGAAAAASLDAPLLLLTPDAVPAATEGAIATLNPRTVRGVGGPAVIPDTVLDAADAIERSALDPGETPDYAFLRFNPDVSPTIRSTAIGTIDGRAEELSNMRPGEQHTPADFSPDGDWLAYDRDADPDTDVGDIDTEVRIVSLAEGSAETRVLSDGDGRDCDFGNIHFSADGQQVAFECVDEADDDRTWIGVSDLEDGGETRWVEEPDTLTARFAEGDDLLVVLDDGDGERLELRDVADPEAAGEVLDSVNEGILADLRVSDDGSQLAMTHIRDDEVGTRDADASIRVVDLNGGGVTELLADADGDAALAAHQLFGWHPDGEQVLVGTGGIGDAEQLALVSLDDDTDQTVIVTAEDLIEDTINRADVSSDGDRVLYADAAQLSGTTLHRPNAWIADADGSDRTELELPDGFGGPANPLLNPNAPFGDD